MSKKIIDLDRMINLFFLFFIGTFSYIISIGIPITNSNLLNSVKLSFILVTLFSYEYILLSFIVHYFAKKKEAMANHFVKNKWIYIVILFIISLVIYLIIDYFRNYDILGALQRELYIVIIILGGLILRKVYEWLESLYLKKKKRRK